MANTTDSQIVEGLSEIKSYRTPPNVSATSASTLTLTSSSELLTIFTGTTSGQIVKLTDATTITAGHRYEFHNNSTQDVTVQDNASTTLVIITATQRVLAILQVAGTAAGTWSIVEQEQTAGRTSGSTTSFFNDLLYDDFHAHSLMQDLALNGGTAVLSTTSANNLECGVVTVGTGTTNNATGKGACYAMSANIIKAGAQTVEWRVLIPVLSVTPINATNPRYNVKCGTQDNLIAGDPANGIYFQYSDNINSGRWVGIARNSSTSSTVNSTITVAINTWYLLKYIVNSAGTSVSFYVNDILIGTYSGANIPSTNGSKIMASIEKTTGVNATVSRTMQLDWYSYSVTR
jgi:hypothetical protein